MSGITINAERGKIIQDTKPVIAELDSALRRADYLAKGSDHNGAAKEYLRASEAAMRLSEHYKASGQATIKPMGRMDWVLMTGYKNKAGFYSGKARNAKAVADGLRV